MDGFLTPPDHLVLTNAIILSYNKMMLEDLLEPSDTSL